MMKLLHASLLVCCIFPTQSLEFSVSLENMLPSMKECGHSSDKSEFPWVTFLPLETRTFNPDAHVRCAGVLISNRYVIFYKTCLQFALTNAKLGVYDTSKNESFVEEVNIEKRIIDKKYDIVLLKLDKDVTFSEHIRPICLPFSIFERPQTGETVYTSGWGLTSAQGSASETIKNIKQVLLQKEECPNRFQSNDIMCIKPEDSDSMACSGDEGSPIMYQTKNKRWVLDGILSNPSDADKSPCAHTIAEGVRISDEALQWIVDIITA